jgi:hypothetical protein
MVRAPQPLESDLEFPVFYSRSEFFNVDGVPVSFGNCTSDEVPMCAAWDVSPPRRFDVAVARAHGNAISQTRFHRMVMETFAGV